MKKQLSKRNATNTARRRREAHLTKVKTFRTTGRDVPLAARPCPTPEKVPFANKAAARAGLRLHQNWRRDELGRLPKPYRCSCGRFHLGHLPPAVVKGDSTRADIRDVVDRIRKARSAA